jgi:hypothetical protein
MSIKTRPIQCDVAAFATGANSAVSASLGTPGTGETAYVTGFYAELVNGTAPAVGTVALTLSGVVGGSQTYTLSRAATATVTCDRLSVHFPYPIRASATATPIAIGGNSGAATSTLNCSIYGYHADHR